MERRRKSQLKTLHKVALLDVVMGQIEATAFLNGTSASVAPIANHASGEANVCKYVSGL